MIFSMFEVCVQNQDCKSSVIKILIKIKFGRPDIGNTNGLGHKELQIPIHTDSHNLKFSWNTSNPVQGWAGDQATFTFHLT